MTLTLDEVTKLYPGRKTPAVRSFTSELTAGVYGLLGPNGAGKSTLMKMMTDQLRPTAGAVRYEGRPIGSLGKSYRHVLGYMPQQQGMYADFTGRRFLWYMAALKGLDRRTTAARTEEWLQRVNLERDADRKLGDYSGGMKQRLLLAQSLLNDPKVLILDEPTAGVDPKERIRIRNMIATLAGDKIVLLATHVVEDIEAIAKEIVLIRGGEKIAQAPPQAVLAMAEGRVREYRIGEEELQAFQEEHRVSQIKRDPGGIWVRVVQDEPLSGLTMREAAPSLEDVYLHLFQDAP
ncbi:ATP-binding cassette domain-containing protein [Paenibacillus sp. FSL W8-1187]|uniref:ATP-binding cassette domain-containing protein n=1 Tax=Paenibacillus sp. FSL W8-1187 TaxID=2975339 RepID=UPI0030D76A18